MESNIDKKHMELIFIRFFFFVKSMEIFTLTLNIEKIIIRIAGNKTIFGADIEDGLWQLERTLIRKCIKTMKPHNIQAIKT